MSRWAISKTGTGNTAGPALKLNIRSSIQFSPQLEAHVLLTSSSSESNL
jgi:hypothetical protein